jgi:hypothetical protein
MKIQVQIVHFDQEKIQHYAQHPSISSIVLGDVSCLYRNTYFLQDQLLHTFSTCKKERWIQLPLVTKENEMHDCLSLIKKCAPYCDGFITGDLGVIAEIRKMKFPHKITYTTNVLNEQFVSLLKKYDITYVRPLMYKRTFIEEEIQFPKDVVIYGNMMINAATFCPHSEHSLVENCPFGCKQPREVLMHKEKLHLIGRSLFTENRVNLSKRIPFIRDLKTITIMDYSLSIEEIEKILVEIEHEINTISKHRNEVPSWPHS